MYISFKQKTTSNSSFLILCSLSLSHPLSYTHTFPLSFHTHTHTHTHIPSLISLVLCSWMLLNRAQQGVFWGRNWAMSSLLKYQTNLRRLTLKLLKSYLVALTTSLFTFVFFKETKQNEKSRYSTMLVLFDQIGKIGIWVADVEHWQLKRKNV